MPTVNVMETLVEPMNMDTQCIDDDGNDAPSPRPFVRVKTPCCTHERPQSAASSTLTEDIEEVFELPAELQWLNDARSLPGGVTQDEEEAEVNELCPGIPLYSRRVQQASMASRVSTPESVEIDCAHSRQSGMSAVRVDTPAVAAAPSRTVRGYLLRPPIDSRRTKNSHLPTFKPKSWNWRSQKESPRGSRARG